MLWTAAEYFTIVRRRRFLCSRAISSDSESVLEPAVAVHFVFRCRENGFYGIGTLSRGSTGPVRFGDMESEGGIEVVRFHAKFLLGTVHCRVGGRYCGNGKRGDEFFRHL